MWAEPIFEEKEQEMSDLDRFRHQHAQVHTKPVQNDQISKVKGLQTQTNQIRLANILMTVTAQSPRHISPRVYGICTFVVDVRVITPCLPRNASQKTNRLTSLLKIVI